MELFERWCAGDKVAGSELFRRYYRDVYRFFDQKLPDDVESAVQKTFECCTRKRDEFRRDCGVRTFLFAIARLVLLEEWRNRRGRETPVDFEEMSVESLSTSIGGRLVRREQHGRLLDALRNLPLEQQLLLELHYWQELDGRELAVVFGIEPATVRSRLFRARDALRAGLRRADDGNEPPSGDVDFYRWARELRGRDDADSDDDNDDGAR